MSSELPTIDNIFWDVEESLEEIYRKLSDVRDILNSDWSDNRHLTETEAERRSMMLRKIAEAKTAVERAKDRRT